LIDVPDIDFDIPTYPTITNGEMQVNGDRVVGLAKLEVTVSSTDTAGIFTATVSNVNGMNNGTFSIDDDVEVFFPDEDSISRLVFKGFVDNIDNSQFGKIIVKGQDYTGKLHNVIANNTYSNREVSTIITNGSDGLITYVNLFGITANHVQTTALTMDVYRVSQKTVWDSLSELAKLTDYAFYIDTDKDLHFEPKSDVSSGVTLASGTGGNVRDYSFVDDYKQCYNKVTVYGNEEYVRGTTTGANYPTETFTGDGTTKTFTMLHTPDKPLVEVKVATVVEVEGTDFSVDYSLAQITFVTAPAGAAAIWVTYNYIKTILASATDNASATLNGLKEQVINDREILSVDAARKAANGYLEVYSDPRAIIKVTTRGKVASSVQPAQSVVVNIPRAELNNAEYNIVEIAYSWGTDGGYMATWTLATISISLAQLLKGLRDQLVELKRRGLTKLVTTDYPINAIMTFGSFTLVPLSKNINTSFIFGVSVCGQHGAVFGDKRDVAFA
jgi:hypothetical protein